MKSNDSGYVTQRKVKVITGYQYVKTEWVGIPEMFFTCYKYIIFPKCNEQTLTEELIFSSFSKYVNQTGFLLVEAVWTYFNVRDI